MLFFDRYRVVPCSAPRVRAQGVIAYRLADDELQVFPAARSCSPPAVSAHVPGHLQRHTLTATRSPGVPRGLPLEDMECYQFPCDRYRRSRHTLLSEDGPREEAYLLNDKGERFMKTCARRSWSWLRGHGRRAIMLRSGRAGDRRQGLHLPRRPPPPRPGGHRGEAARHHRLRPHLPGRRAADRAVPIQPTAHYAIGGIQTDIHGRVVIDPANTVMPGLYAAANAPTSASRGDRLGTNSLVDLLVFGQRAERAMADDVHGAIVPRRREKPRTRSPRSLAPARPPRGREPGPHPPRLAAAMMDDAGSSATKRVCAG